ncbi:MAG: phosphoribosylamine--glycine ligase [Flavobacteriales bacterium]
MKILILGCGGREYAIGQKLLENTVVSQLYFALGNGSTAQIGIIIPWDRSKVLCISAKIQMIGLAILGSETLLVEGIVDTFQAVRFKIFGLHHQTYQLDGSKVLAKAFMKKYDVRIATYESFSYHPQARNHLEQVDYPVVIKASELAVCKGVVIASDRTRAQAALEAMMKKKNFGTAGCEIVIEAFLQGYEASFLSIFNRKQILPFFSAKDHKKIDEGETGLNTGEMGVITPNLYMNEETWVDFQQNIIQPILQGLLAEKWTFAGVIFFGLMFTVKGVYILGYNLIIGDPETRAILQLMESYFLELIQKALCGEDLSISWGQVHACCVVMASGGYPEKYKKGKTLLSGLYQLICPHYIVGVEKKDGQWITSSGRVFKHRRYRPLCTRSSRVGRSRGEKYFLRSSLFPTRYLALTPPF